MNQMLLEGLETDSKSDEECDEECDEKIDRGGLESKGWNCEWSEKKLNT